MSAPPIHWLVIHPNLLFQAEPSNLSKYSKIKSNSPPLDNLLNTDSRKQLQDKKKICTSDMKKANYKKYMKPVPYQQPGSPNTEDTHHVHMATEIPGFSSDQLDLLLPLSPPCCTS